MEGDGHSHAPCTHGVFAPIGLWEALALWEARYAVTPAAFLSIRLRAEEVGAEEVGAPRRWERRGGGSAEEVGVQEVEAYGRLWKLMGGCESSWKTLEAHGRLWKLMEDSGSSWKAVEAHGSLWKAHPRQWLYTRGEQREAKFGCLPSAEAASSR